MLSRSSDSHQFCCYSESTWVQQRNPTLLFQQDDAESKSKRRISSFNQAQSDQAVVYRLYRQSEALGSDLWWFL